MITEDWSNDAENSALYHRNKLGFKLYKNSKPLFYIAVIFHNITVLWNDVGRAVPCNYSIAEETPTHFQIPSVFLFHSLSLHCLVWGRMM